MHAGRILASVPPGPALSSADAASADVGIVVESPLAGHRRASSVVLRANGPGNHGNGHGLRAGRAHSDRHALEVCVFELRQESVGPVALNPGLIPR